MFRPFWQETSGTDGSAGQKQLAARLLVRDAKNIIARFGPAAPIYPDMGQRLDGHQASLRRQRGCRECSARIARYSGGWFAVVIGYLDGRAMRFLGTWGNLGTSRVFP